MSGTKLPAGTRFPKKGDVYESKRDQTVSYLTHWRMPYTGAGKGTLLKGERIWVDSKPIRRKCLGAYASPLPVIKKAVEERMVSEAIRKKKRYDGFNLCLDTAELDKSFTLVETGYCLGAAGCGPARQGAVLRGRVRFGKARFGEGCFYEDRIHRVRQGRVRRGRVRCGRVRRGEGCFTKT